MNSYDSFIAKNYDALFDNVDYQEDCSFVLMNSKKRISLLDIGCGTLRHSILLSKHFGEVTGIDVSEEMIKIAEEKLVDKDYNNIKLILGSIQDVKSEEEFSVIIALENIINHLMSWREVRLFFTTAIARLSPGGTFIFDCWNGAAARHIIPSEKTKRRVENSSFTFDITTLSTTNLMKGLTIMSSQIVKTIGLEKVDAYEFELTHRLWTPDLIMEELKTVGFSSVQCYSKKHKEDMASISDFKILFVCEKLE